MMNNIKRNVLVVLIFTGVFGFGAYAFAGWGMGYGHHGWRDNGSDWHNRGSDWHNRGGYGQKGYYGNLSEEEKAQLDQQRSEFFKKTETIRQNLYEKELALRNELAKEDPDTRKASKLQSDISKLQSELDQKRLDHEIEARKNVPNYSRGYRSHGPMMGYGSRAGGYCWR